jgi:protein-L-isoaspartate(D-aspartate) O-methyltransferase
VNDEGSDLRAAMVQTMGSRGLLGFGLAEAFASVPRHRFVPGADLRLAYDPHAALPTAFDDAGIPISSSSAPDIMATMLGQLTPTPGDRVLEIGTGTGYNVALLDRLVGPDGQVISVELDVAIAAQARHNLDDLGVSGVEVRCADGWDGAHDQGPFDRIEVTVGTWDLSPHWVDQLRPGGMLVVPLWLRPGLQVSVGFVRHNQRLSSRSVAICGFMRLRGPHAGPDAYVLVPGWADRVPAASPEREWIAALEDPQPERVSRLRELLGGPVNIEPAPWAAPGWTWRLALEEPEVIAFNGRDSFWHLAHGLFDSHRGGVAVVDAGLLLGFGHLDCLEHLRACLPTLEALDVEQLVIGATPTGATSEPGQYQLARPNYPLTINLSPEAA